MNRKFFLQNAVLGTGSLIMVPALSFAHGKNDTADPLPSEKVKDFVIAGHGNIEKVKSLLQELPTLLYATWDWGNGDFETALEGAGHVGNKEIANYLVGLGARTNLFVLTMLGKQTLSRVSWMPTPYILMQRVRMVLLSCITPKREATIQKSFLIIFNRKVSQKQRSLYRPLRNLTTLSHPYSHPERLKK
jgi:hypothetical protein